MDPTGQQKQYFYHISTNPQYFSQEDIRIHTYLYRPNISKYYHAKVKKYPPQQLPIISSTRNVRDHTWPHLLWAEDIEFFPNHY